MFDFVIPKGFDGVTGPTGPTGATGATGPTGTCECNCKSTGQLVTNGGMETVVNGKPANWSYTNPNGINSVDVEGRVHTGSWAVNITDNSAIEQTIPVSDGGCYYILSFSARGEGSQVGLTASITFETSTGSVNGGTLTIREQDLTNANRVFGFYQLVTSEAPENTIGITIKFLVNADGNQSLDLDDVSLLIA